MKRSQSLTVFVTCKDLSLPDAVEEVLSVRLEAFAYMNKRTRAENKLYCSQHQTNASDYLHGHCVRASVYLVKCRVDVVFKEHFNLVVHLLFHVFA